MLLAFLAKVIINILKNFKILIGSFKKVYFKMFFRNFKTIRNNLTNKFIKLHGLKKYTKFNIFKRQLLF